MLAVICAAAAISEAVFFRSQPLRELIDDVLVPAPANLGYAAFVGVLAASVSRRKQLALAASVDLLRRPGRRSTSAC